MNSLSLIKLSNPVRVQKPRGQINEYLYVKSKIAALTADDRLMLIKVFKIRNHLSTKYLHFFNPVAHMS